MSDEPTEGAGEARPTGDAEPTTEARLTSEERLRALAGDRKPKKRGKAKAGSADPQHRPGDVVDAVRERTNKDPGKNLAR